MTTARRATMLASLATIGLLGACGGAADAPSESPVESPAESPATTAAPAGAPATTVAPSDAPSAGPIEIVVVVGEDDGATRVERVPLGSEVVLRVRNDDEDDEFHLHGYDLGGDPTPAGEEAVYRFTASEAGEFELESHLTGDLLLTLIVEG